MSAWVQRWSPHFDAAKFVTIMWLTSRLLVWLGMLLVAPLLPVPHSGLPPDGLNVFARWDGEHYEFIATHGYEFKQDGKAHNTAFFPLLPLLIRLGMLLGLPPTIAGILISNLAFLGALLLLYLWVEAQHGEKAARWATAVMAWCPFSVFGAVVYTEGLFLLCSTAALKAFDQKQYGWASFWGALTTATRPPGMALIPTFLLVAWREKRGPKAYLAGLAASAGLLLFMLYCWVQFNQPWAFWIAQQGWRSKPQKYFGSAWVSLLLQVLVGHANEDKRRLVDPWYPLALLILLGLAIALWLLRRRIGFPRAGYGFCVLAVLFWIMGGSPLINLLMVFGGGYLIWRSRHALNRTALYYGAMSWGIILSLGRSLSAERFAYAVVTLSIALGLLLSRYPRWGYAVLVFFGFLLISDSVRFAQKLWVG